MTSPKQCTTFFDTAFPSATCWSFPTAKPPPPRRPISPADTNDGLRGRLPLTGRVRELTTTQYLGLRQGPTTSRLERGGGLYDRHLPLWPTARRPAEPDCGPRWLLPKGSSFSPRAPSSCANMLPRFRLQPIRPERQPQGGGDPTCHASGPYLPAGLRLSHMTNRASIPFVIRQCACPNFAPGRPRRPAHLPATGLCPSSTRSGRGLVGLSRPNRFTAPRPPAPRQPSGRQPTSAPPRALPQEVQQVVRFMVRTFFFPPHFHNTTPWHTTPL